MKLKKILGIGLFSLSMLALVGCRTSFCSEEDIAGIKTNILENIENETGTGEFAKPTHEKLIKAGVTVKYLFDNYAITVEESEITWDYIGQLEYSAEIKNAYVEYVYKTYHPQACLTVEERTDKNTGATISGKSFGYAFKQGLLEILAWPVSWLIVQGSNILSGGTEARGWAICISIVIVTFLIRGIILLLTFKSTKQSQKMQELQPELDAINNKYQGKNDDFSKNAKAAEMMQLYKKYDVNPMKSMISPFLTLPIFIAVYSAVKDTTIIFEGSLFGLSMGAKLGTSITSFNVFAIVLFVIMAGTQFVAMRLPQWLAKSKTKKYKQPKQKGPNSSSLMTYMFLGMIIVISIMLPVAMTVYWIASSIFSIFQTYLMYRINQKQKDKKEDYIDVSSRLGV